MEYMARHGRMRSRPADLVPGTLNVISVRMDYWPGGDTRPAAEALAVRRRATSPDMPSDATTTA